ncbi:MAG: hypothetical protein AB1714_31980 [Acidobacteriota bacterium]
MVTLWTFPRDQAFRFASERGTHAIEVLNDVFSRTSHLRKAALLQGRNLRSEFTTGRVLDFQAGKATDAVANYWTSTFLKCTLAITSDTGTRLLARTLGRAYTACASPADHEQLFGAVIAVRVAQRQRWSLGDFAEEYLGSDARKEFLRAVPNEETLASPFDLNRPLFDQLLHFRIFRLDTGVYVSSPPSEIGRSVRLTDGDNPRLACEGRVVSEKLKIRHA